MEHVLWIGGAPGAGKTTVATRIARRHGLRWYGADTRTWEHRDRALREGNAATARRGARPGPHARTHEERRRLLREANTAIVHQVRGYYARPWAKGDSETVEREFLCECGDPNCEATVLARLAEAATGPVLASNHVRSAP